jgi:glucose-6-phosphate 1-epimerase
MSAIAVRSSIKQTTCRASITSPKPQAATNAKIFYLHGKKFHTSAAPRLLSTSPNQISTSRRASTITNAASDIEVNIPDLNKEFGIPGHVEVISGREGLPTIRLTHACGASAEITLYGACVTSWKQPSGDEVLYIRPDAVFNKSKPISGGVPHCFPQFGPGKMQQHGFARNLDWTIASTSADAQPDDRDPEVSLVLIDNDYTRKMWPHAFKVVYSVSLHGEALRTDMRVMNTGDKPFEFTSALHTYFEVLDVEKAKVGGLKGLEYLDKVANGDNPPKKTESRDEVTFSGPVDSVYTKAKDYVQLDVGTGAGVAITSSNWNDVVVWSPWTSMPDCYKSFVCVENAQFSSAPVVKPGESWRGQTEFSVKDL